MIYRNFEGLRFEALSPSHYRFRLARDSECIDLKYGGCVWHLQDLGGRQMFISRTLAVVWLKQRIEGLEKAHKVRFHWAHMEGKNAS